MASWSKLPTLPVWFLSAIAIVVVLVGGMWQSYFDPSGDVDGLEVGTYPAGAKVAFEGGGTLAVHVGQKVMGPGWFGVGTWRYDVTFPDGTVLTDQGPLTIVDKANVVVRCEAAAHTCVVAPDVAAPATAP